MNNRPHSDIVVRLARLEDSDRLHKIQIECIRVLNANDYNVKQIERLINYTNYLHQKHQYWYQIIKHYKMVFVAEKNGEIIGFSCLSPWAINAMFVAPLNIRQGVGTKLLLALEKKAIDRNWKVLTVVASITSIPFYRACGYRVLKKISLYMFDGKSYSVAIPCVHMEKWLKPPTFLEKILWDLWTAISLIL
ncbi:MAG: GNAT family N-acetyltransferase, partial [Xenococcaceae cyanobacterium]